MDAAAESHSLEIVIDDKPAALAGTVSESGRPASQPHVVVVQWPVDLNDPYSGARVSSVEGDKNGKFQKAGLRPGEYRVFAVAAADRDRLEEPHVLERMLGQAQKVELSRGGFQDVRLELLSVR